MARHVWVMLHPHNSHSACCLHPAVEPLRLQGRKAWVPHTAVLLECLRKLLVFGSQPTGPGQGQGQGSAGAGRTKL